jgi:Cu+-exporting ATPase
MANASKKLINYSGVMLGYSSVEEFAEVNSVVIDAGHLFPTGTVEFVNLKMLGSTMIDKGIIYAASMARAGNSITQPAFYKMLRGQIEMTLPVNDCAAEDNLGVVGTIEGNRVLLGNRKLMERHGIEGLPSIPSEEEFADGSCIMYLAVSGKAAMMFAIDLAVGASAERWVQEMEDESIDIHVRCSDGFITRELLANMLDISPSTIRLLPSNCDGDCKQIMSYEESISASMFCSGHLPSFSMLLIAAKRLKFVCNLGIAVQYGAMILGIVISVIMMLTGSFAQITPTIVIIYNLAFLLLTYLMQSMRKI